MILERIKQLKEGYSEVWIDSSKYGVSKKTFNDGKSIKVFAEELRGNDFISFNYYMTQANHMLKPCEMKKSKVIQFLEDFNYR